MEFPLVPAGSLNVAIRERADRVPQPAPEFSNPSWAVSKSAHLLRAYKPSANTLFIDSQYLQEFEPIEDPGVTSKWGDIVFKTVRTFYQKTAASQQPKKHTIDLYV